ncbi:MAG TPA: hypothetical protein VF613_19315 [Longimicrobium sp.]|jgi:hypothetical protein
MLLRAEEIQEFDDHAHRRVDDDMLDEGVALRAVWAWALFGAGLAVAIGLFFVYTPR